MINGNEFEVFVDAKNIKEKSLNTVSLLFNTNGSWNRSGNPGILAKISYNVGHIKYSNGWGYQLENNENIEFKETSAHEIGHSILKSYGGMTYSWQHKGTSYLLPQDKKPTSDNSKLKIIYENSMHVDNLPNSKGELYPKKGEIDLMKYYHSKDANGNFIAGSNSLRTVASEKDLFGLIWLTKIKIL